jgi:hypothetical protein
MFSEARVRDADDWMAVGAIYFTFQACAESAGSEACKRASPSLLEVVMIMRAHGILLVQEIFNRIQGHSRSGGHGSAGPLRYLTVSGNMETSWTHERNDSGLQLVKVP